MADTDLIKMRLTFWRDGKKPGDLIDVPVDEVHRWKGYAEQVEAPKPTAKSASPAAAAAEQPKATK
ncbi:hypothetical protein OG384_04250 [Streptomyces sp. NBC_01324]|uniref:hypothetical protein n=1 Tax=Streptomyces sp. NBC_01324 TaxID=2903826 RepID=UPI002E10DD81|nr:hypothetical protein OG384_04250 [Streptomyces sp. NBC_01324]